MVSTIASNTPYVRVYCNQYVEPYTVIHILLYLCVFSGI